MKVQSCGCFFLTARVLLLWNELYCTCLQCVPKLVASLKDILVPYNKQICQKLQAGGVRVWNDEHKTPYAHYAASNGREWIGYDDVESLGIKVKLLSYKCSLSLKLGLVKLIVNFICLFCSYTLLMTQISLSGELACWARFWWLDDLVPGSRWLYWEFLQPRQIPTHQENEQCSWKSSSNSINNSVRTSLETGLFWNFETLFHLQISQIKFSQPTLYF